MEKRGKLGCQVQRAGPSLQGLTGHGRCCRLPSVRAELISKVRFGMDTQHRKQIEAGLSWVRRESQGTSAKACTQGPAVRMPSRRWRKETRGEIPLLHRRSFLMKGYDPGLMGELVY